MKRLLRDFSMSVISLLIASAVASAQLSIARLKTIADIRGSQVDGRPVLGRGRDTNCSVPPAQIRTCGFPAYGSCLRS